MRLKRYLDLDSLAALLSGRACLDDVELWNSRTRALSRAISFIENEPFLAVKLLQHPHLSGLTTPARVVGITGLPGAGKSSLTSLLVGALRQLGKKVAVIAVDPSSVETGGAILGDRIRMQDHFCDPNVFIRSLGSRGALGGVSAATRGIVRLTGLLGFDFVLVETVGIGQSESEIVSIADTTMLVLMPNSGDDIQLMKAGILQLANIYVVNKSDLARPERMIQEIQENSHPADQSAWVPPVIAASAIERRGVAEIVDGMVAHAEFEAKSPHGFEQRSRRIRAEILQDMHALANERFLQKVQGLTSSEIDEVRAGRVPAIALAGSLVSKILS